MQPLVFLQRNTACRLLIAIIFFVSCYSGHAQASTQHDKKVTLSGTQISFKEVFKVIRKQTGLSVFFSDYMTNIQLKEKVDVNFKNTPLDEVMRYLLRNKKDLSFKFTDDAVVIFKEDVPKSFSPPKEFGDTTSTSFSLTGKVTDAVGTPIVGATVAVKGSSEGTTSNEDGTFSLPRVKQGARLTVSSIGYETREITVRGKTILAELNVVVNELDETVVIAYGTTTQRYNTGNVATVKAKDIEKQPVNNPLLALQGRVPGLNIIQANGIPGGGVTVRIQGRNNLDNSLVGSDPLIVVDGVPYPSQNLQTFLGGGTSSPFPILGSSTNDGIGSAVNYGSPLAYINTSDIESISVLKDADATAIYGSRAANGALLITTKKGQAGQTRVDVNLQQGWGKVGKKLHLLNSEQYMEMRWEAKQNENLGVSIRDYDLRGLWDTTRYTDWQKALIGGTSRYTRLTAGVSGGTSYMQYLISSTYGKETTVFPGDFANISGSVHFNISATSPNRRLKIQLGGSYAVNKNALPAEDFTNFALNLPPVAPALYTNDGSLNWAPDPLQNGNSSWFNPLSKRQYLFDSKVHNLISNGSIGYALLPGLEIKSTFGFTSITSDQFVSALDESEKPERRADRIRQADFSFSTSRSWILEPQLNFQKKIRNHSLSLLSGATFQYQSNNGRSFVASGQSTDLLLRDMTSGTSLTAWGADLNEYKYTAVFGRLNYSFLDRYLFNITGRRDGSSRFGPNRRFHNFGAIGVGWILSEEAFLKNGVPFVSFAKLRGSYGTTGNDQIGNYRFMSLYGIGNQGIPYQGGSISMPMQLPNPNLEWEETRKLQLGVDLRLLKDRMAITVNYNRNRTSNSLTYVQMPTISGFDRFLKNIPALIQNTGWEFSVSNINIDSKQLRWTSNFNLTIPRNKLLSFPGLETSTLRGYMEIGHPLNIGKVAPFYGIDPNTGNYQVRDRHGNPVSNPAEEDRTIITYDGPRWYGGFENSISYKGFTLDFLFQFTKQYGFDLLTLGAPGFFSTSYSTQVLGNQLSTVMQRWRKPGDNTIYQRFSSNASNSYTNSGDLAYKNLSFVRMKNVVLSYNIEGRLKQRIKMQQLRLYINAQNLFTITRYQGLDPETQSIFSLPPLRMVTIGVQTSF